jgi:hypothetical protein
LHQVGDIFELNINSCAKRLIVSTLDYALTTGGKGLLVLSVNTHNRASLKKSVMRASKFDYEVLAY